MHYFSVVTMQKMLTIAEKVREHFLSLDESDIVAWQTPVVKQLLMLLKFITGGTVAQRLRCPNRISAYIKINSQRNKRTILA